MDAYYAYVYIGFIGIQMQENQAYFIAFRALLRFFVCLYF